MNLYVQLISTLHSHKPQEKKKKSLPKKRFDSATSTKLQHNQEIR
jgi:hypothetical protein